jgi:hypothetical protein
LGGQLDFCLCSQYLIYLLQCDVLNIMKSVFENFGRVGAASILAASPLALKAHDTSHHPKITSICKGLEVDTQKGGPGVIEMDVIPTFNKAGIDEYMKGSVIRGNDKGENFTDVNNLPGESEFEFTWNTNDSRRTQAAKIAASIVVPGLAELQRCPDTTIHYNPSTGYYSPAFGK